MRVTTKSLLASVCLCIGSFAASVPVQAATSPLTIETLLSAPFPYSLTASPRDERIAWIANHLGARNIWLGERNTAGTVQAKAMTRFEGDNGIELDNLNWSHDGSMLVFARGGSLEGGGPVNPLSLRGGPVAMEVAALRIASGEIRSFGLGAGAVPSPVGDEVVFVRDGQIWIGNLSQPAEATQLLHDRGVASELSWSSDGKKIAFISNRQGYSLVGVLDLAAPQVRWMSPSADNDSNLHWSPDGKRLAWIRTPSQAQQPYTAAFMPNREGPPWSVRVADVASGVGKAAWIADAGRGSVFQAIETGPSLFWTKDDRLLFPWEATGWLRLYSLDLKQAGARPVALTPDGAETFAATLDNTGRNVIFSSNAEDDDHRHLWRVAVGGGRAERLSKGASIEDFPVVTPQGALFAMHSTGRDPLRPASIGTSPVPVKQHGVAFPSEQLVVPERVVFASPDGVSVHGQLFMPASRAGGKRPAMVFFHGGPQRQMLLGWHPMGAYTHLYAMNQFLASQGYVVLSVNFRGGTGYGLNFREPDEFAAAGGSEARDIAGAVAFLKSRSDVDPKRIGAWGLSYGGVMTALALARYPDDFAAGVDIAGVHNWKTFIPQLTQPGQPEAAAELALQSSAMGSIRNWRAPVLIIQGDDDRAVDFAQMTELVQALRSETKVEPEQLVIPDEVHDFILYRSWVTVFRATHEFLERHLGSRTGS
jgi:dipeptidyl aminopeptidase/acylaminoacyl peptidase